MTELPVYATARCMKTFDKSHQGFGQQDPGLGIRFAGFGSQTSRFGFRVVGIRDSGFGSRVSGLGSRVSGRRFRVSSCQDSGLRFRDSGFGLRGLAARLLATPTPVQCCWVRGLGSRVPGSEGLTIRLQGSRTFELDAGCRV